MANRQRGGAYHGFVEKGKWTGRVELIPDQLEKPLHWRKPRKVAVALMGDLFHEALSDEQIAAVFGTMALADWHTYQLLTKRPQRMLKWFDFMEGKKASWEHDLFWPLSNVHLGVSVEDQVTADERIPFLLQTPAAVRWVSYEPALGPVSLRWLSAWPDSAPTRAMKPSGSTDCLDGLRRLDWVVIGGESGPGARPCNVEWIRSAVRQCREAGVACFVKQLGRYPQEIAYTAASDRESAMWQRDRWTRITDKEGEHWRRYWKLKHPKGADPAEWPEDLRVREFPR
jgi:protein gp37